MPYPALTDTASLPLADRFHTMVLDINDQLGWPHDVLALELWRMAERVTGGGAAAIPAIHGSRVLLRAALATAAVDPSTVADALQILDQIARLLDP